MDVVATEMKIELKIDCICFTAI